MTVIMVCHSKHYHCVSTEWIHKKLESTRWMNSCVMLFDIWYCKDIFIVPLCKPLASVLLLIHTISLQEWRQLCVCSHRQTKASELAEYTNNSWLKLNLLLAESPSPNHLAFESLLILTVWLHCAAEHFILAPTTDADFHQLQQQTSQWPNKHLNSLLSSLKH